MQRVGFRGSSRTRSIVPEALMSARCNRRARFGSEVCVVSVCDLVRHVESHGARAGHSGEPVCLSRNWFEPMRSATGPD